MLNKLVTGKPIWNSFLPNMRMVDHTNFKLTWTGSCSLSLFVFIGFQTDSTSRRPAAPTRSLILFWFSLSVSWTNFWLFLSAQVDLIFVQTSLALGQIDRRRKFRTGPTTHPPHPPSSPFATSALPPPPSPQICTLFLWLIVISSSSGTGKQVSRHLQTPTIKPRSTIERRVRVCVYSVCLSSNSRTAHLWPSWHMCLLFGCIEMSCCLLAWVHLCPPPPNDSFLLSLKQRLKIFPGVVLLLENCR